MSSSDDISNVSILFTHPTNKQQNSWGITVTAAIPGSKTKRLKILSEEQNRPNGNFSFWHFHPNFTLSFHSKIYLLQRWACLIWYSEKHRTLMTSITYGPFHFVVLFWKLKQLRLHITLRTQNLRPFRILYTNFEWQTGFWRSTKGNYSS